MDTSKPSAATPGGPITIRPLTEKDVPAADRVMRLAFGTFLLLPEPESFLGDASYIRPRWKANPAAAFAAVSEGELIGSNLATQWGTVGFVGPLTIRPDFWDRKVGTRLMEPIMECFARWGTKHAGLFTFAASPKHAALYQKFGFWPRFLTAVMSKAVPPIAPASDFDCYSKLSPADRIATAERCARLTGKIFEGLDVTNEVEAVFVLELGETLLLDGGLDGFAVCHCGAGTEAGTGVCYVKFAAVRPGEGVERRFGGLLNAIDSFAKSRGLGRIAAGVSIARIEAYQSMLTSGFRTDLQGVAMHRPNEDGYHRRGVYVLDDWR